MDGGEIRVLPDGVVIEPVLSLRDYFAAQALAGSLSDARYLTACRDEGLARGMTPTEVAVAAAYAFADAMLQARHSSEATR